MTGGPSQLPTPAGFFYTASHYRCYIPSASPWHSHYAKGLDLRDNSLTLTSYSEGFSLWKEIFIARRRWMVPSWALDSWQELDPTTAELRHWDWPTPPKLQGWFWDRFPCRISGSSMWTRSPPSVCLRTLQGKRICEMHTYCYCFSLHVGMLCKCLCVSVCKCIYAYVYPWEDWNGQQIIFISALLSPHLFQSPSAGLPVQCVPGVCLHLSTLGLVIPPPTASSCAFWWLNSDL